jgi:hypothetical protein
MPGALGRRTPADWEHLEKWPLAALPAEEQPRGVPVVLGVNWYTAFDAPVKIGSRWWVGRGSLGSIRGGHCICVPSPAQLDLYTWWDFYDQGHEGACVGFGSSRAMSLLNRRRYDARWLWDRAKAQDDWPDTNPGDDEGTSVRAAMDVLRGWGHVRWQHQYEGRTWQQRADEPPRLADGIAANRWAATTDEVIAALGAYRYDACPFLNSWGRGYPHKTWMPWETLQRLLTEDGEAALVTDR